MASRVAVRYVHLLLCMVCDLSTGSAIVPSCLCGSCIWWTVGFARTFVDAPRFAQTTAGVFCPLHSTAAPQFANPAINTDEPTEQQIALDARLVVLLHEVVLPICRLVFAQCDLLMHGVRCARVCTRVSRHAAQHV